MVVAARVLRRESSLRAARHWLQRCSQHLLVTGPSFSGKTYFVKQLAEEQECVAVHYCRDEEPESTETATLIRSIAGQLVKRFPNLTLPALTSVTLLSNLSQAVETYLTHPLTALPSSSKSLFLIVENVQPLVCDLVLELAACLPCWLRLVISTRPVEPSLQFKFKNFHELVLSENADELCRYIELRLPQCSPQEVFDHAQDSWFFVEQLARGIERGLLSPDRVPLTQKRLLNDLKEVLPPRLPFYLSLIRTSRAPPPTDYLLAVAQLSIHDHPSVIEKELCSIGIFAFEEKDPVLLSGAWNDVEELDLSSYHSAWAELYKTKPRKTPQDLIELAYHLAHSGSASTDSIRILSSLGCSELILRCAVVDVPTTSLLCKAGATVEGISLQDDLVFLSATGDLMTLEPALPSASSTILSPSLIAAAARGHFEICLHLLDYLGSWQVSAMQNALRAAACSNHLRVVDLFISRGVDVNCVGHGARTALRAAAWAGHSEIVERLLEAGALVDARDSEGRTALMAAAFMDHNEVVDLLLEKGADIEAIDSARATALHLALANGAKSDQHSATVGQLLKESLVGRHDAHGRLCIHLAAFHGDSALGRILEKTENIDVGDSMGRTPLMLAASQGKLEAVDSLVAAGADIDAIDGHGRTALQLAAAGGHLTVVDLLLTLGADEAHTDNDGAVALHYAVTQGDVALARALATSSTIRAADRLGQEPLVIAAQNNHDHVVSELLALGASADTQTLDGMTAMRAAALSGNSRVVHALSDHVLDWDQRDLDGSPLLHSLLIASQTAMAEMLISLGASISSRDAHGRTPVHVVCATNDVTAARMLRRVGAGFEEKDEGGRSPLMTAVWGGGLAISLYLLDTVGVDANAVDSQRASALSIAAQLGHRELVVMLLRFGADPALRDEMGRTALDVAQLSGHEHIRSVLKTASGSADSSGFGSMPASPLVDQRSLARRIKR